MCIKESKPLFINNILEYIKSSIIIYIYIVMFILLYKPYIVHINYIYMDWYVKFGNITQIAHQPYFVDILIVQFLKVEFVLTLSLYARLCEYVL